MDTDIITRFSYVYGGIESVVKGDSKNITSIERADIDNPEKNLMAGHGIILPRVIGVYQQYDFIYRGMDEEAVEEVDKFKKSLEKVIDEISKKILELRDKEDRAHPRLICIGYEPDIMPLNLVRATVNNEVPRLAYFSCRALPDFNQKNTGDIPYALKTLNEQHELDKESAREIFKETIQDLREQLEQYGLTRWEYALLNSFERFKKALEPVSEDRELIDSPFLISLVSNILGLDKNKK